MAYLPAPHSVAVTLPKATKGKAATAALNAAAKRANGIGAFPSTTGSMFPGDGLGDDGLGFIQAIPAVAGAASSIIKGISSLFGGGPNPRIALAKAQLACVQNYGDITAARVILLQKDKGATADGRAAYQQAWNTIVSQYPAIAARAQQLGPASDDTRRACTIGPAPVPGAVPAAATPAPVVPVVTPPAMQLPAPLVDLNVQPVQPLTVPAAAPVPVPAAPTIVLPPAVATNAQLATAAQQLQARRDAAAQALAQTNAQIAAVQQQLAAVQAAQSQAAAAGQAPPAAASSSVIDQLTSVLDSLAQKSATASSAVQTIDSGFQQLTSPTTTPDQAAALLAGISGQTQHVDSMLGTVDVKTLVLFGGGAALAWFMAARSGRRARR